jgi:hypothetical protein
LLTAGGSSRNGAGTVSVPAWKFSHPGAAHVLPAPLLSNKEPVKVPQEAEEVPAEESAAKKTQAADWLRKTAAIQPPAGLKQKAGEGGAPSPKRT